MRDLHLQLDPGVRLVVYQDSNPYMRGLGVRLGPSSADPSQGPEDFTIVMVNPGLCLNIFVTKDKCSNYAYWRGIADGIIADRMADKRPI